MRTCCCQVPDAAQVALVPKQSSMFNLSTLSHSSSSHNFGKYMCVVDHVTLTQAVLRTRIGMGFGCVVEIL